MSLVSRGCRIGAVKTVANKTSGQNISLACDGEGEQLGIRWESN